MENINNNNEFIVSTKWTSPIKIKWKESEWKLAKDTYEFCLNTDNSANIGENNANQTSKLTASSSYEESTPSSRKNLMSLQNHN